MSRVVLAFIMEQMIFPPLAIIIINERDKEMETLASVRQPPAQALTQENVFNWYKDSRGDHDISNLGT